VYIKDGVTFADCEEDIVKIAEELDKQSFNPKNYMTIEELLKKLKKEINFEYGGSRAEKTHY
jgi:hypothetical protein